MKTTITFIFLLLNYFSLSCLAQDIIDVSDIKINNQVLISDSKSAYLSILGQPHATKTIESEMEDLTLDILTYNQSTFTFAGNDLFDFSIRDNSISITLNNINLTVGDNISLLQNAYPNSYNLLKNKNDIALVLTLRITQNGQTYISDDWISIGVDPSTGVIDSIHFVRP